MRVVARGRREKFRRKPWQRISLNATDATSSAVGLEAVQEVLEEAMEVVKATGIIHVRQHE